MASNYTANKIINGAFGRVWINGALYANVKSFEAKLTLNYEDVSIAGELGTSEKYLGYSISGTITMNKTDDNIGALLEDGITSGVLPDIEIVARLQDPAAYGAERIHLTGVTFDELSLMKYESKKNGEEEVPFKASGFEYLDKISA